MTQSQVSKITLSTFTALAISSIFAISNLSVLASNGPQLIVLLAIVAIVFFIPVSAVMGELATGTGWGTTIYSWIKSAYGVNVASAAVFWEWFKSIICAIPVIYFIVGTFAYAVKVPALTDNIAIHFVATILIYLALVGIQVFSPKLLIKFEAFAFWGCIVLPLVVLFTLSLIYVIEVKTLPFELKLSSFIPAFDDTTLLALVPFVLSLTGIENSGPFVQRLKNIKIGFPKAILIVLILGISVNLIGSGALALLFKGQDINLSSGVIQAFALVYNHFNLPEFLTQITGVVIVIGILPKVGNWILGPALTLQQSAQNGVLPDKFSILNQDGVPIYIIIFQSYIFIALALLLSMTSSGNTAYLIAV